MKVMHTKLAIPGNVALIDQNWTKPGKLLRSAKQNPPCEINIFKHLLPITGRFSFTHTLDRPLAALCDVHAFEHLLAVTGNHVDLSLLAHLQGSQLGKPLPLLSTWCRMIEITKGYC